MAEITCDILVSLIVLVGVVASLNFWFLYFINRSVARLHYSMAQLFRHMSGLVHRQNLILDKLRRLEDEDDYESKQKEG